MKDIFLDAESSDLVISAWPTRKERWQCGLCYRKVKYLRYRAWNTPFAASAIHVYKKLEAAGVSRVDGLVNIEIDEIKYKKGNLSA